MINLAGHIIAGVGYEDSSNDIYIHDTWDCLDHSMTWGSSYSGMAMQSVSIVSLQSTTPSVAFNKIGPAKGAINQLSGVNLKWEPSSGVSRYEYYIDTTNDNMCSNWIDNGTETAASVFSLKSASTYYWQVKAVNDSGEVYANGSSSTYWSFTTA